MLKIAASSQVLQWGLNRTCVPFDVINFKWSVDTIIENTNLRTYKIYCDFHACVHACVCWNLIASGIHKLQAQMFKNLNNFTILLLGKFNLEKLYEKIGFNKEIISRGRYAELTAAEQRPFRYVEYPVKLMYNHLYLISTKRTVSLKWANLLLL